MNFARLSITALLLLTTMASVGTTVYLNARDTAVVVNNDDDQPTDPNAANVILKAPNKARLGELVVLDVTESNATSFKWRLHQKTKNFLVIDGGKRAVFSAEAGGTYTFVIAGAKNDSVDVKIHTIRVDGGPAEPSDDIAAKISSWSEPVNSPTKKDDAVRLAKSFMTVAGDIKADTTPAEIVEATKKSNRVALGDNLKYWEPFLIELQKELQVAAQAGKLPDAMAHADMWQKIADGLTQYADTL